MTPEKKKTKRYRVISLRVKTVAVIILAALVLSAISVTISYRVYSTTMDEHYKAVTTNLARTAATQLDPAALLRYYDEARQIGTYDDDRYENDGADRADYDAKAEAIPQSADGSTVYISTAEQLAYYAYAVNNEKMISGSGYYCGQD